MAHRDGWATAVFLLDIFGECKIRNKLRNMERRVQQDSRIQKSQSAGPAIPGLVFAFALEVEFDLAVLFASLSGERGFLRVGSGRASGPRLNGTLAEQAGDWPVLRPDGVLESDSRYVIRADDGALVYMRARGYLRMPDLEAFRAGERPAEPAYYRVAPQFDASVGAYQWMSQSVFVGSGRLTRQGARIDVFEVL